ncbi:MAG TPA: hypothetical protein VH439_15980 [Gemmatimonadales bacterium]|jgi:hypothetical protein
MTAARRVKARALGPRTLTGSAPAKRIAVVLLEVLSGVCGPADGSRRLGLSMTRYYALETRGLQGLLAALEPRPRGRTAGATPEAARREQLRLEREVLRLQALVRTTQRAVAVAPTKDSPRRRTRGVRARKVIAQLRATTPDESAGPAAS